MEVILKKAKITNSILKQTLRSTVVDLEVGEVLGWCVYNKYKFIIIYRSEFNTLSKYNLIKSVTFKRRDFYDSEHNAIYDFDMTVNLVDYGSLSYTCKDDNELDKFIDTINRIKNEALSKGQFFV